MQQGNEVQATQLKQLKIGMSENQVRFVLGAPLLTNPFNPNRWDYTYAYTPPYAKQQVKHLTLYFKDGKLARIAGGPTINDSH